MSAGPDPEGFGLLAKFIAAGAAVFGPVGALWLYIDNRFAKKTSIAGQFHEIKDEVAIQRTHIAKLFDKLEEHGRRNDDANRAILQQMSHNHSELLMQLAHKEDRK